MNDNELLRYSRQIMLPQFGIEGQERLRGARALIVGMGGLGAPAAMYLAAAGTGTLAVADFDRVDLTNLQRQIIHHTGDIGRAKVQSARDTLHDLNPDVEVVTLDEHLQGESMLEQVRLADVVLDCCDNFTTRFAVNRACVKHGTPLVSGAAIRMEGQISVFRTTQADRPCYRCLYRDEQELAETCTQTGVLAPLVGIVGSLQALEAIKVITGIGETLTGRLLLIDAMTMEWRTLKLPRDPDCQVCGQR